MKNKAIDKDLINRTCFNCLKQIKTEKELKLIEIPELGYGSEFDGLSTKLILCEKCYSLTNYNWWNLETILDLETILSEKYENWGIQYKYEKEIKKFINQMSLPGQELFYNRFAYGSSVMIIMDEQDWIDYELGTLSHEKCKKYGLYSPDEINAYKKRFPICEHPVNIIYNDGSKHSQCPFGAIGKYNQKIGDNISSKCFQCENFKKGETSIMKSEIPSKKTFEKQRVKDLSEVLYFHFYYKKNKNTIKDYEEMIKLAEEMVDRLYNLKFDKEIDKSMLSEEGCDN